MVPLHLMNGTMESVQLLKNNGVPAKGRKNTSEQIQTLKIPEAFFAFAQAAAMANGETEKYLSGWPLLTPSKVELQKCDKCSQHFCSTINYRRHIRVHRRSLKIAKDSLKNREFLSAFWDKLSLDEAKEIVSLDNFVVKEVTGSSVIKELTSLIPMLGLSALPQIYLKAGMSLLDIVHARPSRFPISSQDLFNVLDDASERTFLCGGTALSMQKFMFDREAGKTILEMKNIVACASFMLELKLVEAWLADKDTEALRCQKLLVEEEEAAQKRQAEALERKRLKKLRQKEQKVKELTDMDKIDSKPTSPDMVDRKSVSEEIPSVMSVPDSDMSAPQASGNRDPFLEPIIYSDYNVETDLNAHSHIIDVDCNINHLMQMGNGQCQPVSTLHLAPKPAREIINGACSGQVLKMRSTVLMKHDGHRDMKATLLAHGHKMWARKTKPENDDEKEKCIQKVYNESREHKQLLDLAGQCEIMIGSISVPLGDGNDNHNETTSIYQENPFESDIAVDSVNGSETEQCRPVGHHEKEDYAAVQMDCRLTRPCESLAESSSHIPSDECGFISGGTNGNCFDRCKDDSLGAIQSADLAGPTLFSSHVAGAFLAQRWEEAMEGHHVKLCLPPDDKTSVCIDNSEDGCIGAPLQSSDWHENSMHANVKIQRASISSSDQALLTASKPKFKIKVEKGYRMMYVPKQQSNALE